MKRLIKWHKNKLNCFASCWNLSAYQIFWLSWAKGLLFGYLVGEYL